MVQEDQDHRLDNNLQVKRLEHVHCKKAGVKEENCNNLQTNSSRRGRESSMYFIHLEQGGLDIATLVTAKEIFCLGILEGAAGDEVDPDEHHQGDDEDDICLPPFLPQISQ